MNRVIKLRSWSLVGEIMLCNDVVIHSLGMILDSKNHVVMQFTGLTDKNGVEIFEGDIIECWGYNLVVKWVDSDASFFAESFDQSICESGQEWGGDCEVIGNIYQNPELLKQ